MKKFLLAVLLAPNFFSTPVHAADLLSSWRAARAYDANFAAASNALTAGMEKAKQGDAAVLPQIGLGTDVSQINKDYQPGLSGLSSLPNPSVTTRGRQYDMAVSLVQPIYDAAAFVTRDQLKNQTARAQVQYLVAEQDLILRVAKAYFEVLLARASVQLVHEQKEAVSQQLEQAKKSFEVGVSSITDSDEAQARYDTIIASEILAANELEIKSNAYRQLTDLDPAQLVAISDLLPAVEKQADALTNWLARANENNLSIKAQQLGLDIARRDIDRYRLENSPTLFLVASYGKKWQGSGLSSSGGRDLTNTGTIGLQLSIPLYTGGNRSSHLREAVALMDQQRNTLEAVRRDTEQLTKQFFLDVESGAARIRALEQARLSSASSLASSKLGLEVGVRTTIDVLNAEQNYYQTLYNLVAARYDYLFNKLQFAAAVGGLNEAELANVNNLLAAGTSPKY